MTLTLAQQAALAADLDPRRVSQRAGGSGKALSYLKAHDVKRTANRIFGYDGWSYRVAELVSLGEEPFTNRNGKEGLRVGYRAVVTVTAAGVERGDVGYGDAMEYTQSRITPHELAAKEAVSDALKRCLSSWGDQFGLVLYGEDPAPDLEVLDSPRSATGASGTAPQSPPTAGDPPSGDEHRRAHETMSTLDVREGDRRVISRDQQVRLFTIARKPFNAPTKDATYPHGFGLTDEQIKNVVDRLTGSGSTTKMPRYLYDQVMKELSTEGEGANP